MGKKHSAAKTLFKDTEEPLKKLEKKVIELLANAKEDLGNFEVQGNQQP